MLSRLWLGLLTALCFCASAHAQSIPTLLKSSNPGTTAVSTLAFALGVGASVGDLVVLVVGYGGGTSPVAITAADNHAATTNVYQLDRRDDKTTSNTPHSAVLSSLLTTALTTSDTITVTFTVNTVNYPMGNAYKITGMAATLWADQSTGNTGVAATSASSGATGTTGQANEILMCAITFGFGGIQTSWVAGSGWTADAANALGAAAKSFVNQYQIVTSVASYTCNGTMNSSEWSASVVSYKAANSGTVTHLKGTMGVGQ